MANLITSTISGAITGVGNVVNDIGKTFWGSQEERDQQSADLQKTVDSMYTAEWSAPEKSHWFDIFIDGMNRLVRPFMTYGVIAIFIWAAIDPASFAISMQAMTLVPELMWYILLSIVGFWFGTRVFEKMPASALKIIPPTVQQVAAVVKAQQQVEYSSYTEDKYQKDLQDASRPLSNQAILEWNRRNNPNYKEQ